VLAPGVGILSVRAEDTDFIAFTKPPDYSSGAAIVGDDANYYRASGTSFATAQVTGLASRLLTLRPQLKADDVRHMLVQSAIDIGAEGVDQQSGYGRVDLVRALAAEPNAYIDSRLTGIDFKLKDEQICLHEIGSARADDFKTAELTVRAVAGSVPVIVEDEDDKRKSKNKRDKDEAPVAQVDPYTWQPFIWPSTTPIVEDVIGSMNLDQLMSLTGGSTHWELRLLVRHQDGSTRESRLQMALPAPDNVAQVQ